MRLADLVVGEEYAVRRNRIEARGPSWISVDGADVGKVWFYEAVREEPMRARLVAAGVPYNRKRRGGVIVLRETPHGSALFTLALSTLVARWEDYDRGQSQGRRWAT